MRFLILALAIASGLAASDPARADDDADCVGYGALADNPEIALGRIADGAPRVNFVQNGSDAKGCPSEAPSCRAKAYLVPGNVVLLSRTRGAFVCVDYIGANGSDRAGWLPAAATTRENAPPVALADWVGTWLREEASVTFKPAKAADALVIHGDATFGAQDPDRVKRGGVNIGEIQATVAPTATGLSFDMGTDKTLPVDKGDQYDCKVWMRRLGPYLIVDDNTNCGGANVSFRGIYARQP